MGLTGYSQWEEGEEPYSMLGGRRLDIEEMGGAKSNDRGAGGLFAGWGMGGGGRGAMGGLLGEWSADVPAETLADDDSKFADVFGLRVHYKEVWPSGLGAGGGSNGGVGTAAVATGSGASVGDRGSPGGGGSVSGCSEADGASGGGVSSVSACDPSGTGIVLVHGFGGGVFAWRHIMEDLALQCQCRVVAFDRPGFGE